ncbi:MAG: DUF2065 domain-containing protein [Gammaproteobacteria bacterium]|nr:DUF2065 domain-containing protein [Gammaproteobacteria bacterium]
MAWGDLLAAIALYLVIEGLLPFVSPAGWRRGLAQLGRLSDGQLRMFGLVILLAGLTLLLAVRGAG